MAANADGLSDMVQEFSFPIRKEESGEVAAGIGEPEMPVGCRR
jgi:hypothetical protein